MRKLTTLAILALCSTSVLANSGSTIFSCTLTNGESFSIQRVGNDYLYKKGNFSFKNSAKEVLNNEKSGIDESGSGFTGVSLQFKHDNKEYALGLSQGRGSKAPPHVEVWANTTTGKNLFLHECNTKKKIITKFERNLMKMLY